MSTAPTTSARSKRSRASAESSEGSEQVSTAPSEQSSAVQGGVPCGDAEKASKAHRTHLGNQHQLFSAPCLVAMLGRPCSSHMPCMKVCEAQPTDTGHN